MFMASSTSGVSASLTEIQAGLRRVGSEINWGEDRLSDRRSGDDPVLGLSSVRSARGRCSPSRRRFTAASFMLRHVDHDREMIVWRAIQGFIAVA